MITYNKASEKGMYKRYVEGNCLSTDEKPIENIANGSILMEMDTGKLYMFDEENKTWKEW